MNIVSYCIPFVSLFLSLSLNNIQMLINHADVGAACLLAFIKSSSLQLLLARSYGETIEISITKCMLHLHSCAHVVIAIANCCLHFFD